jgi:hypothetical protein
MKALILSLILSLGLSSCKWIKSLGPEEPFFCKINGEKFSPEKDDRPIGGGGAKPLRASFNKDTGVLFIAVRNSPREMSLLLKFDTKIIQKQSFTLESANESSKAYYLTDNSFSSSQIHDLISTKGTANITKIDGFNIWGTFEFVCQDSITKKEYKITEGEFNKLSYF